METNLNKLEISENKDMANNTIKYMPTQEFYNEKVVVEPKLVGRATRKELIEREIIFDAPKKDVILKVVNVQKEIEIKDIKVTKGNIIVSGYLSNCIMYATTKRPQEDKNNNSNNNNDATEKHGYINTENNRNNSKNSNNNKNKEKEKAKPSCGVIENSIALDGVLRHTTVWIPFKAFIIAEEVQEDDIVTVASSNVIDKLGVETITPIYEEEEEDENEETISILHGEEEKKFIKGIINKTLIEITVDIKRL